MSESDELQQRDPLADIHGAVDLKYEEEGDWFEHADPEGLRPTGPNQIEDFYDRLVDRNGNGLRRVKVRSRYLAEVREAERRIDRLAARKPKAKRDEYTEIAKAAVLGRHCVLDWDFTDRQGNSIPCEPEIVERIMREEQYRYHRLFLVLAVGKLTTDIGEVVEEDRGN